MTAQVLIDNRGTIFYTEKAAIDHYGKRYNPKLFKSVTIDYDGSIINI